MAQLMPESSSWLQPMLDAVGESRADPKSPGGWTMTPAGLRIESQSQRWRMVEIEHRQWLTRSMIPKPTGAKVPKLPPMRVASTVAGAVVAFGMAAQFMVDQWKLAVDEEMKRLGIQKGDYNAYVKSVQDTQFGVDTAAAASAAAQYAAQRIRNRTMTRTKTKTGSFPRVLIHGYSRRRGKTVASSNVRKRRGKDKRPRRRAARRRSRSARKN